MRRSVRWFLIAVLVLNTAAVVVLFGGPLVLGDVTERSADAPAAMTPPTREALMALGRQLADRTQEIERRELELQELLRSEEVQRRIALLEAAKKKSSGKPGPTVAAPDPAELAEREAARLAFERLQRAFENMEPESAATALAELAGLDQEAALQVFEGWKPRTSGAILDALTQTHPALAAKLSYEIWRRSGNGKPPAASPGP
ncbi:MAG: hypothetical protein GY716_08570 [bacterium]|nr:hypothetical protein [bacterium]